MKTFVEMLVPFCIVLINPTKTTSAAYVQSWDLGVQWSSCNVHMAACSNALLSVSCELVLNLALAPSSV
jgi:hypothetical protein